MQPMHPEHFKPGAKYMLKDRGDEPHEFQSFTTLTAPGDDHAVYMVFDLPDDPNFPSDYRLRMIQAKYPIWAMEVK